MTGVVESLPILILYPHSRCNCRCVMCDIWKVETAQEITPTELERHMEEILRLGVEWVVFSGGEPLMHSDLFRLARMVRSRGIRATLLSTGLLLSRYAGQIAASIDDVIVSLDGPPAVHDAIRRVSGAYNLMAAGVAALHSLRDDYPVAARSTVQRENVRNLRETVRTARELRLQSISFLAADLTSEAFNRPSGWPPERQATVAPSVNELTALETEIEALISEECSQGFVLEAPEKLRRIVSHFRAHHGLEEPEAPRCNAPWVSAVVESDGTVRPCFFHAAIGNLRSQTFTEAINGPVAAAFRVGLRVRENPVCRTCVCSLHRGGFPERS